MTSFEIAVTLVLIAYGVIFGIVCAGLFSRTRRNNSSIEITNRVLDCHDIRIDGVVDRVDYLVQLISDRFEELEKEDTSTNSKAGYGHVFTLTRASMAPFDERQITVHTIDDLKTIWDKYGHIPDECFDDNRLIINFDRKRIIIYDDWVE